MEKIKLGVSTCLLGEPVRYDGGHKLDRFLTDVLGRFVEYVPVCPEVECGLPVPRESMHLEGHPEAPRLISSRSKQDLTDRMLHWAGQRLKELEKEELCGFIFKSNSPSSGMERIKVFDSRGMSVKMGRGIFARAFISRFPLTPVEDEGRLHDMAIRENFIERIFAYHRWLKLNRESRKVGNLVEFHARHKYLIMAHSSKHYSQMGRLIAHTKDIPEDELFDQYGSLLMEALKLKATVRKNTNILQHLAGYFKKDLTADEKSELQELITGYHSGYLPLIVPVTLLNHYTRKFGKEYLRSQYYLHPHPIELQLRNHV